MKFKDASDRGPSQCVGRSLATNPRGQDVDTRSENGNLWPKVGERRHDVVGVNGADGVCGSDAGRRVIRSITGAISTRN